MLLIDADAQGSLTASLGYKEPDAIEITLASVMGSLIKDEEVEPMEGILHHEEGIDLMPGNIELSGLEVSLVNVMSRERIIQEYISMVRDHYDYTLIDCMPSLGMITINAFACADSILIPVQAAYLPVKGLQQLIKTIGKVKRQINPKLEIEGVLLTMVDSRTNYARDISAMLKEAYGSRVKVFTNIIPISVRRRRFLRKESAFISMIQRERWHLPTILLQRRCLQMSSNTKTGSASKIKMESFDDLFGGSSAQEIGAEQIINAPLADLHEFKDHPFKVLDDEKMEETTESIRRRL